MRGAGGVGSGNARSGAAGKPAEAVARAGISAEESRSRSTAGLEN